MRVQAHRARRHTQTQPASLLAEEKFSGSLWESIDKHSLLGKELSSPAPNSNRSARIGSSTSPRTRYKSPAGHRAAEKSIPNAKSPLRRVGFALEIYCRRSPNLPHTYACSTIGPASLNFRVRDGNGWDPRGMLTGKLETLTNSTASINLGGAWRAVSPAAISRPRVFSPGQNEGKLAPSSLISHNEIDWVHYRAC